MTEQNDNQLVCAWCGFVNDDNPPRCACEENQEWKEFLRDMEFENYWQNKTEFK